MFPCGRGGVAREKKKKKKEAPASPKQTTGGERLAVSEVLSMERKKKGDWQRPPSSKKGKKDLNQTRGACVTILMRKRKQ